MLVKRSTHIRYVPWGVLSVGDEVVYDGASNIVTGVVAGVYEETKSIGVLWDLSGNRAPSTYRHETDEPVIWIGPLIADEIV